MVKWNKGLIHTWTFNVKAFMSFLSKVSSYLPTSSTQLPFFHLPLLSGSLTLETCLIGVHSEKRYINVLLQNNTSTCQIRQRNGALDRIQNITICMASSSTTS